MSQGISDVSSLPTAHSTEATRALQNIVFNIAVADIKAASLSEIYETYKKLFIDNTDTSYVGMRQGALKRLGMIFRRSSSEWSTVDAMKQDIEIYSRKIQTEEDRKKYIPDPENPNKDMTIDQICREGYMALRFYVKSIADYMEALDTCIGGAQTALTELKALIDDPALSNYEKSQQAISIIDRLAIAERYSEEVVKALIKYSYYNNDTKQWEISYDRMQMKYEGEDTHEEEDAGKYDQTSKVSRYEDYKANGGLSAIRNTEIDYKDTATSGEHKTPIQVFSSLSMIDRAKFIYYYYMLIMRGGDKNYINFPDDKETGFPCLPDIESKKDTEATKHLGALEMFYVGYLTDRDGPINAVSSFFEIKVQALRENLSIQSKSISALNTYLEFINRGLNVLNASQSGASDYQYDEKKKRTGGDQHRIPDGAMIALTYLCGGNMYNLVEAKNGTKCLVIENNKKAGEYMLVPANEAGMNYLLGDNGNANKHVGNCYSENEYDDPIWYAKDFSYSKSPDEYFYSNGTEKRKSGEVEQTRYNQVKESLGNTFVKPPRIDCVNVIPNSVKEYKEFHNEEKIKTEVVSSWTDAFSSKTKFINTAIDTINTDIQVDRSKIDSFDSICSTFRSRAHEAHSNTAANVR